MVHKLDRLVIDLYPQSDNATNMATPAVVVLDPMDPEEVRKLRLPELRTLAQGYGIGSTRRRKNVLLKAVLDFMREHAPPLTPWTARDLSAHDAAVVREGDRTTEPYYSVISTPVDGV